MCNGAAGFLSRVLRSRFLNLVGCLHPLKPGPTRNFSSRKPVSDPENALPAPVTPVSDPPTPAIFLLADPNRDRANP